MDDINSLFEEDLKTIQERNFQKFRENINMEASLPTPSRNVNSNGIYGLISDSESESESDSETEEENDLTNLSGDDELKNEFKMFLTQKEEAKKRTEKLKQLFFPPTKHADNTMTSELFIQERNLLFMQLHQYNRSTVPRWRNLTFSLLINRCKLLERMEAFNDAIIQNRQEDWDKITVKSIDYIQKLKEKNKVHLETAKKYQETVETIIKLYVKKLDIYYKVLEENLVNQFQQKINEKIKAERKKKEKKEAEERAKREEMEKKTAGKNAKGQKKKTHRVSREEKPGVEPLQIIKPNAKGIEAWSYSYLVLVTRSMVKMYMSYNMIDTYEDETFRKIKRKISTCVNQITATKRVIQMKTLEITQLLEGTKKFKCLFYFALKQLAEKLVKKASIEVPKDKTKEMAVALANVSFYICLKFKEFRHCLIATIFENCPWAIPWYISRSPKWSDEDYFVGKLQYEKQMRGIEDNDSYYQRMEGIIAYYAAFCSLKSDKPHPHNYEYGWIWLSDIIKKNPHPITPTILLAFLDIAGFRLFEEYMYQFGKMVSIIKQKLIPSLKDLEGVDASAITRIELYYDYFKKNGRPKKIKSLDELGKVEYEASQSTTTGETGKFKDEKDENGMNDDFFS